MPEDDLVSDGWTSTFEVLAERVEKIEARLGRKPTTEELNELSIINDYRVTNGLRARIDETVISPETADALKSYYRWWCKRPGWHDDYLESFNRDNVHLIDTNGQGVESFTKNGVVVDGKEYPLDCVIMATGFEATIEYTRLAGFEFHGRGTSLTDHWRKAGVRTFHGIATDQFPNLFFIGGNLQTTSSVNAVHLLD